GSGGRLAAEDLAVAIDFAFANAHELDVDPTGYALWGSSAGARMAAVLGSHGTIAFGQGHRPRPSAVIMAYTGHSDISGTVPPTLRAQSRRQSPASAAMTSSLRHGWCGSTSIACGWPESGLSSTHFRISGTASAWAQAQPPKGGSMMHWLSGGRTGFSGGRKR